MSLDQQVGHARKFQKVARQVYLLLGGAFVTELTGPRLKM